MAWEVRRAGLAAGPSTVGAGMAVGLPASSGGAMVVGLPAGAGRSRALHRGLPGLRVQPGAGVRGHAGGGCVQRRAHRRVAAVARVPVGTWLAGLGHRTRSRHSRFSQLGLYRHLLACDSGVGNLFVPAQPAGILLLPHRGAAGPDSGTWQHSRSSRWPRPSPYRRWS